MKARAGRTDVWLSLFCCCILTLGCGRPADEPAPNAEPAAPPDAAPAEGEPDAAQAPQTRRFRFVYGAVIRDLEPGARARVWLPLAASNEHQRVERVKTSVPGEVRETVEKKFGNKTLYFEAAADEQGQIPLEIEYLVQRTEVVPGNREKVESGQRQVFLVASKMVPVDPALTTRLLGEKKPEGDTLTVAQKLYDAVEGHMKYDKPEGGEWGRGDSLWACDSKYGNCTDFHSLFLSVSRDLGIPGKFEMGFPIPVEKGQGEVGGYHCWAKFAEGDRWVPVDISEADKHPELKQYYFGQLTPDRVQFTTGRDLHLDPPTAEGPVNFLIYPYVEVDGKQHKTFEKRFRYKDLDLAEAT